MRFSTPNSVLLSTENSTTDYVVEQLGLTNPIKVSARAWGIKQDRINRLQNLEQSYVLYVQPFPQESKLNSSPLWQAMPFVKKTARKFGKSGVGLRRRDVFAIHGRSHYRQLN